jgi:uncharacterized membrane-anchored protein
LVRFLCRFVTNVRKHIVPLRYTKEQVAGLARKTYFDSSFVQTLYSPVREDTSVTGVMSIFELTSVCACVYVCIVGAVSVVAVWSRTGSRMSVFELELDGTF